MDYEFLEDIYVKWHQGGEDDINITSNGSTLKECETNSTFGPDDENQEYEPIDNKTTEEIEHELEKKKSHPLMLMVYSNSLPPLLVLNKLHFTLFPPSPLFHFTLYLH